MSFLKKALKGAQHETRLPYWKRETAEREPEQVEGETY